MKSLKTALSSSSPGLKDLGVVYLETGLKFENKYFYSIMK